MAGSGNEVDGWTSSENMQGHFEKHGQAMNYGSSRSYSAGARANMSAQGTISGTAKNGNGNRAYFNPSTGRLTLVNSNGRIISYMPSNERYFNKHFE